MPGFSVMYRLAPRDIARADGGPFDTRRDAIDHRDWYFGHAPGVLMCWIENAKGKQVGALLSRESMEEYHERVTGKCADCQGAGELLTLPHGSNPFNMKIETLSRAMVKVRCQRCQGRGRP